MTTKNFRVKNGLEVGNNTTIHVTANSSGFHGNGAGVTSVNAATVGGNTAATLRAFSSNATNITTGTLNNARLPSTISVTSLSGNGAGITSINATSISTGTLNNARLPSTISVTSLSGNGAGITSVNAATVGGNTALDLRNYTDSISPIGQQTIWVPAAAMYPTLTNGSARGVIETTTNKIIIQTLDFDAVTKEYAQFAIQMPKSWNESTIISQFIWSHASTSTNFGVVWEIQSIAFGNSDALDSAFGTAVAVADTGGTTNDLYITSETSVMTVAGSPAAEEYVTFQIARVPADGSDTMTIDARLHGVKLHYTIDAGKDD